MAYSRHFLSIVSALQRCRCWPCQRIKSVRAGRMANDETSVSIDSGWLEIRPMCSLYFDTEARGMSGRICHPLGVPTSAYFEAVVRQSLHAENIGELTDIFTGSPRKEGLAGIPPPVSFDFVELFQKPSSSKRRILARKMQFLLQNRHNDDECQRSH